MPSIFDPFHMHVNGLPGVWSPVQWELSSQERVHAVEQQARASLLFLIDVPEAILRMLLDESEPVRAYGPPDGYDPELQGDWNEDLVAFEFKHPIRLTDVRRESQYLAVEYDFESFGRWLVEVEPEKLTIKRI